MNTAVAERLDEMAKRIAAEEPDIQRASATLYGMVTSEGLSDPIVMEACQRAATEAIVRARHNSRITIKAQMSRRTPENMEHYARATGLFDRWMVGSLRLGDCGREELERAAKAERERAKGHVHNAAFYEALAGRLGTHQTVRDAVSEKTAEKILKEAGENL